MASSRAAPPGTCTSHTRPPARALLARCPRLSLGKLQIRLLLYKFKTSTYPIITLKNYLKQMLSRSDAVTLTRNFTAMKSRQGLWRTMVGNVSSILHRTVHLSGFVEPFVMATVCVSSSSIWLKVSLKAGFVTPNDMNDMDLITTTPLRFHFI